MSYKELTEVVYTSAGEFKKICRICMEENGNMISPCLCKDGFVHRDCLNKWRALSDINMTQCEVCKFRFVIEEDEDIKKSVFTTNCHYYLLFFFDIVMLTIISHIPVGIFSLIFYTIDDSYGIPQTLQCSNFLAYYIVGWGCSFFVIGLCSFIMFCLQDGYVFIYCGDVAGPGELFMGVVIVVIMISVGIVIGLIWFCVRANRYRVQRNEELYRYLNTALYVVKDNQGGEVV